MIPAYLALNGLRLKPPIERGFGAQRGTGPRLFEIRRSRTTETVWCIARDRPSPYGIVGGCWENERIALETANQKGFWCIARDRPSAVRDQALSNYRNSLVHSEGQALALRYSGRFLGKREAGPRPTIE